MSLAVCIAASHGLRTAFPGHIQMKFAKVKFEPKPSRTFDNDDSSRLLTISHSIH